MLSFGVCMSQRANHKEASHHRSRSMQVATHWSVDAAVGSLRPTCFTARWVERSAVPPSYGVRGKKVVVSFDENKSAQQVLFGLFVCCVEGVDV